MLAHLGTPDEAVAEIFLAIAGLLGWVGISRLRGRSFLRLPKASAPALVMLSLGALAAALVVPSMMLPNWSSVRPRSNVDLAIVRPAPDEVVRGPALEVDIDLTGGRITPTTSTNLSSSAGHVHLSIDGQLLSMTGTADTEVDISGLGTGRHVLQAEFVAADHGPFQPRVVASVSFEKGP